MNPILSKVFLIIFIFSGISAFAQNINYQQLPQHLQLYPRDAQDMAEVQISGTVVTTGFDTVKLEVNKNNQLDQVYKSKLNYSGPTAGFTFTAAIHAEQSEYSFKVYLDGILQTEVDSVVCGDVLLINGQSNALAIDYDGLATWQSEWLRSYGNSATGGQNDTTWGLAQAQTVHSRYAVGVWGLRLGQMIVENTGYPVAILNGASSGSDILYHFRNDNNPYDGSSNYGRLLTRAENAGVREKVKAILWNQGESDTFENYVDYETNFAELYYDWKTDFPGLKKIYTFQIRPCNQGHKQSQLRNKQRKIDQEYQDVEIMSTVGLPGHDGLHYHYTGYKKMAEWIYPLVAADIYGSNENLYITPPKIQEIFYTDNSKNRIAMVFDQPVVWPDDTLGYALKDHIYLNGESAGVVINSGEAADDTIFLNLSGTSTATSIQYLPNSTYNNSSDVYEGPWIKNVWGIGALTFHGFAVGEISAVEQDPVLPEQTVLLGNFPNPFNPATTIKYRLEKNMPVQLTIYDMAGKKIETVFKGYQNKGQHSLTINGAKLAAGVYIYKLQAGQTPLSGKIVLLK